MTPIFINLLEQLLFAATYKLYFNNQTLLLNLGTFTH